VNILWDINTQTHFEHRHYTDWTQTLQSSTRSNRQCSWL